MYSVDQLEGNKFAVVQYLKIYEGELLGPSLTHHGWLAILGLWETRYIMEFV
jgi:hypothetical protein